MTIIRSCHILIFRKYFVENEIYKNKTLNNFFRNSFENLEGVPPRVLKRLNGSFLTFLYK